MIRDRLVVGIRDTALSEWLQMDAELTLEKAKTTIGQREAVHEQQHVLKGGEPSTLEALHASSQQRQPGSQQQRGRHSKLKTATNVDYTGKEAHPWEDAKCHKCKNAATVETNSLEVAFLDVFSSTINTINTLYSSWTQVLEWVESLRNPSLVPRPTPFFALFRLRVLYWTQTEEQKKTG